MSFGEGNLHEKCEMYRRQLGGANAASNRKSARIRELVDEVDKLKRENGRLLDDVCRQRREVDDIKQMVGELPTDGKSALFVVKREQGELIWGVEPFDFASYVVVDLDADTYTGKPIFDPFDRADWGDRLTLADRLRAAADTLTEGAFE